MSEYLESAEQQNRQPELVISDIQAIEEVRGAAAMEDKYYKLSSIKYEKDKTTPFYTILCNVSHCPFRIKLTGRPNSKIDGYSFDLSVPVKFHNHSIKGLEEKTQA